MVDFNDNFFAMRSNPQNRLTVWMPVAMIINKIYNKSFIVNGPIFLVAFTSSDKIKRNAKMIIAVAKALRIWHTFSANGYIIYNIKTNAGYFAYLLIVEETNNN